MFVINPFTGKLDCVGNSAPTPPPPPVEEYITFVDPAVEAICVANWGANGKLSYTQASVVSDLGYVFAGNIDIISFDELQYFTALNGIGNNAFQGCSSLTSIIIPNSVTSIGNSSFKECLVLTSVIISNTLISVGPSAFQGCTNLASVNLPNSITSIGVAAFANCTNLASVNLPNSITSIGDAAFASCANLASVIIPNTLTSIGNSTFIYCTGLTSVIIPSSVTSIGDAFNNCSGITSMTVESIIPPSLGPAGFTGYNIATTHIYVPAESVDAYKAATDWNIHAPFITAII